MLDVDPERTSAIVLSGNPVRRASSDDYSSFLVFSPGETEQSYTFSAVDDAVDEDDKRVNVGFTDLPGGVSVGIPRRAFVDIGDNDKPETVVASFSDAAINVKEGNHVTLGVRLDQPAEQQINDIPLVWEY